MSVVVVSWICSHSSNITILQVNKMHAQNFTYHLLTITLKVVFLYNLFHWYTPYNSVSDSLRIVLHYYIQYEVRFSLSYFKKEIYLTINIQIFPFLLSHFAYIVLHSLPYHLSKICMMLLSLEQCHESSHPRWPLIGTNLSKNDFQILFCL